MLKTAVLLHIFVENMRGFFSDCLMNRKFRRKAFIWKTNNKNWPQTFECKCKSIVI